VKVLESVIAQWIYVQSEEHDFLLTQHMGARPGGSIDKALNLLV
jgi:hypothetical protein